VLTGAIKEFSAVQNYAKRFLNAPKKPPSCTCILLSPINQRHNIRTWLAENTFDLDRPAIRFDERPRRKALVSCHEQAFAMRSARPMECALLRVRLVAFQLSPCQLRDDRGKERIIPLQEPLSIA
jgi:hypothetical protein